MKRLLVPMFAIGLMTCLSAGVSVFQDGLDGYAGTADTELRAGSPDLDSSNIQVLNPDGSDNGEVHVLLRFDDMFGTGPGQIPPGQQIFSVVLTLTIEGAGPGNDLNFHRMNKAWAETVSWNEFDSVNTDGILSGSYTARTADDSEASFELDGTTVTDPVGVYDIPLAASTVQGWYDGSLPNYGWGILPTGNDGVDFPSSEDPDVDTRPKLTVTWGPAGQPYIVGLQNVGPDGFDIVLEDGFGASASQVDPTTINVQLDGADVPATSSKAGTTTTVTYLPTEYLVSGAQHVVTISFSDNGTPATPQSEDLSLLVPDYVTIPPDYAVNEGGVNKSLSGFRVHMHQIGDTRPGGNDLPAPLIQLNDGYIDPDTGLPYENLIYREDPMLEVNVSYTWQPFDANDFTVVDSVVNWEHTRGLEAEGTPVNAGNFIPDDPVPGIPGVEWDLGNTDEDSPPFNNIVAEILTVLELKQGIYRMGVNSDDGFFVDTGMNASDLLAHLRLGVVDGGRGAADTIFLFEVQQDGIYPFRLVWWEGGGDASLEWFTVDRVGTKTLVNDSAVSASVKAYQQGPLPPYVKSLNPGADSVDIPLETNIEIVLEDGASQVQPGSVQLSVDGELVTPVVNKVGGLTTITYDPPADFAEETDVTVTLAFSDNANPPNARSEEYTFTTAVTSMLLFAIDDTMTWRYLNDGSDQGTAWKETAFNDSAWPQGPALLAAESGATAEPIRTTLVRTGPASEQIVTDYYRGRFTLTELPFGGRLQLRHVVDDAVIFYINGVEVHRFGLTEGAAINYQTLGTSHENTYEGPFIIVSDNLVVGENVIAAEVHQTTADSSDSVFGAELAVITSQPSYPQVTSLDPAPDDTDVPVDANIEIKLLDGAAQVQTDSIQLSINGEPVTPVVVKTGTLTTITYDPEVDFPETSLVQVDLAYSDTSTPPYQGVESYTFTTGYGFEVVLAVDESTLWRYSNVAADLGTAWKETGFDDSAWPEGAALLAAESGATAEPIRTTLLRTGPAAEEIVTDYFRTRFTLTELPAGGRMLLRFLVDDGAVFYINGAEVYRFGIAEGPVDYTTLATSHEGRDAYDGPFLLVLDNLVVGENVLAAELHQTTSDSSDSVFGAELSVVTSTPAATDPEVELPTVSGSDITIRWSNGGELQTSNDLETWSGTGNTTGEFSEPLDTAGPPKFYRVAR